MLKILLLSLSFLFINLISLSKKTSFNLVLKALKAYKFNYGDFNIKYNFVISDFDTTTNNDNYHHYEWPAECYGLRLGNIVSRIRNRGDYIGKIHVNAIIDGTDTNANINISTNKNINNLQTYLDNRRLLKEIGFMIPSKYDDNYNNYNQESLSSSPSSSFALDPNYEFTGEFNRTLSALRIYHQINGHVNVPTTFIVPNEFPWSNDNHNHIDDNSHVSNRLKNLSGLKLGKRLHSIRLEGAHTTDIFKRLALEDLGVNFERQRGRLCADDVLLACRIYKNVFGHLIVPHKFIIPNSTMINVHLDYNNITLFNNTIDIHNDIHKKNINNSNNNIYVDTLSSIDIENPWPKRFWGLQLGYRITHIRNRGSFREIHEELTKLGFEWDAFRNKEFHNVLEALASALLEENMVDGYLNDETDLLEDENLQEFLKNLK